MHVVAITRWGRPVGEELAPLAALVGEAAYDLRLRLAGPLPVVLARVADGARAAQLTAGVRARGHGAVDCDLAEVQVGDQLPSPRSYRFEPDCFTLSDPSWPDERSVAYGDLIALIAARAQVVSESTTTTTRKKVSIGRAIATGGLMMRKKETQTSHNRSESREPVLYLVAAGGQLMARLSQSRLKHQGLGDRLAATSVQNFALLVEELRRRAPAAVYHDGLATRVRPASSLSHMTATSATRTNASELDLAVHLVVAALVAGQL